MLLKLVSFIFPLNQPPGSRTNDCRMPGWAEEGRPPTTNRLCSGCSEWRAVYSVQCSVCNKQCVIIRVCNKQCVICSVQYVMCSVQFEVCSVNCVMCGAQCTLYSV